MKSFAILLFLLPVLISFRPTDGNPNTFDSLCLNKEEQRLYDLIMAYRKENKLPTIPLSGSLTMVAAAHTKDLMGNYKFDFNGKCNPHSWSAVGKWTPCCYTADHKAAACMWDKPKEIANYPGPGYEIAYYTSDQANALEAIDGWKKSEGHNPLLINSGIWQKVEWKAIGISLYGNYGVVWFGQLPDTLQIQKCN